ncbi:MAG TPA: L,D-transpeptidase family protein, partial [Thermoanaerobaculia bacterium]|nr:L,D-transpeptidase family protein [Thermoanaerobaculia bacterium]
TPGAFKPLWVEAGGRPNADARAALGLIAGAATDGLDPAEYRDATLARDAARLDAAPPPVPAEIAAFDSGLSAATMRYLQQLHAGRVEPRAIGFKMTAPVDEHDFAALLTTALAQHRVVETAAELTPPLVLYRALRAMLGRYRQLAADSTLTAPAPLDKSVKPGEPYAEADALRRLLVALGDLPASGAAAAPAATAPAAVPTAAGVTAAVPTAAAPAAVTPAPASPTPPAPVRYEGSLVDGVKHFQLRHGLEEDGVLGKGTQVAIAVPLARRVRQIELALERLRWAPHLDPQRFLAVNIPMYRLWVWQGIPSNGAPLWGMNVIVGRALDHSTPIFAEEMKYVVFRPYWNVPPSILRGEVLPALRRDSAYLARQNMEVVAGQGDESPALGWTPESLALLEKRKLRVRQRPGPRNALGLVKFVFPNDDNVYLHSTPSQALFSRSRRDFSHGCVRVEDPVKLAEWALQGQEGWTHDRIVKAVNGDRQVRVSLARPIQVLLFYITAVVMPEDRTARFAEDIYGHDARLDKALVERAKRAAGYDAAPAPP